MSVEWQDGPVAPVYVKGLSYEMGEPQDIGRLQELRDDPELLATLRSQGLAEYASGSAAPAELAAPSAERTLWKARVQPGEVDAVVYATSSFSSERFFKRDINEFFRTLELSRAYPIGVTLSECSNLIAALRIATGLVRSEGLRNVLVVTADAVRHGASRIVAPRVSVASDAAATFVVSGGEPDGYEVVAIHNHMIPFAYAEDPYEDFAHYLKVSAEGLAAVSRGVLKAAGCGVADIRWLLPNNYNTSVTRLVAVQTGVEPERIYTANIARVGHAFGSDNVINLADCTAQEPTTPGDQFMLLASGPNTWGAAVLRKV